jgi:hypothetical protein
VEFAIEELAELDDLLSDRMSPRPSVFDKKSTR